MTIKTSMPTRWKHGLALAGIVIVLGAAHVGWLEPRDRERRSLEGEERRLRTQVADLEVGVREMERWAREHPGVDGLRGRPKRAAPAGTMVASLLDALATIGAKHRVRTARIEPVGAPVDEVTTDPGGAAVTYRKAEIRFRMDARYRDLGEYLAEVESLEQLVVVRSVALRHDPSIAPRLVADVTLWVYGTP